MHYFRSHKQQSVTSCIHHICIVFVSLIYVKTKRIKLIDAFHSTKIWSTEGHHLLSVPRHLWLRPLTQYHFGGGLVDYGANPIATPDWCLITLCQLGPFLFLAQIHTEAIKVAFDADLPTNLHAFWVTPSLWRNIGREVPTKSLHQTSNGTQCICHHFFTHSTTRWAYLAFLRSFASCSCSSHGVVSSPMIRILAASAQMTMSKRRCVMAAATGKTSLQDW